MRKADGATHLGVGIGDLILDLHSLERDGFLNSLQPKLRHACTRSHLNALMRCGGEATSLLRRTLTSLLRADAGKVDVATIEGCLAPMNGAEFCKPIRVRNYSDFYASIHHATNVGRLFRPDQPLLPNYKFVPIGYHGRASSLVVSGTPVVRPSGQTKELSEDLPGFRPSRQLDYELEVGAYISRGNRLGKPISIQKAEDHIFGLSLVNDWSARDIQAWEYQPLGPFLGKSFATSVSPWVITMDALTPFRVSPERRPPCDPPSLPYLTAQEPATAIDLRLEVYLSTGSMRAKSVPPVQLSSGNLGDLYWSFAQMVAHHTSNGCNLLTGDLLASGTISGPAEGQQGSLLEITRRGADPIKLPDGSTRSFLEDGDEVVLRGYCERPGIPRIGLGECRGIVVPAVPQPAAAGA